MSTSEPASDDPADSDGGSTTAAPPAEQAESAPSPPPASDVGSLDDHEEDVIAPTRSERPETRDPFADDPLTAAEKLDLEQAPEPRRDPFQKKKSRRRPPRRKEYKAKAVKSSPDPFAADPLGGTEALDTGQLPDLDVDPFKKTKRRRKKSSRKRSAREQAPAQPDGKSEPLEVKVRQKKDGKRRRRKRQETPEERAQRKVKERERRRRRQREKDKALTERIKAQLDQDDSRPSAPAAQAQPRSNPVAMALALAIPLALGAFLLYRQLEERRLSAAKRDFAGLVRSQAERETVLTAAHQLPSALLSDPQVAGWVEELETSVARAQARQTAEQAFAGFAAAKDDAGRRAICRAALEADPGYGPAAAALARSLFRQACQAQQDRPASAETLLEAPLAVCAAALAADPGAGWARFASVDLRLGAHGTSIAAEAAEELRQLQRLELTSALGAMALGYAELLDGAPDSALRQFDKALERDRALPHVHRLRGEAYLLLGQAERALSDAIQACNADPGDARALVLRARTRVRWGRSSDTKANYRAQRDLDEALSKDPHLPQALALKAFLGLPRRPTGELDAAVVDRQADRVARLETGAERALERDPEQRLAALALAELAFAAGRLDAAASRIDQALAGPLGPEAVLAQVLAGQIHQAQGQPEAALAAYERALSRDPDHPAALGQSGALLAEEGYLARARWRLGRAVELDDSSAERRLLLGRLALDDRPRRLQAARQHLERALALDAENPRAQFELARLELAEGNPQESARRLAAYYAALKVQGGEVTPTPEVRLLQGQALYAQGRWDDAYKVLGAFLQGTDPADPRRGLVERRRADCLLQLGKSPVGLTY